MKGKAERAAFDDEVARGGLGRELPQQRDHRGGLGGVSGARGACRQHRIDLFGRHHRAQQKFLVRQVMAELLAQVAECGEGRLVLQLPRARTVHDRGDSARDWR